MKIEHKMPTSKQMRDEMQRKLDADELLGASHVPEIKGGPIYANGSLVNAVAEFERPIPERNRDLIDCYLSGQISEQNWQQHLNEEPGLAYAWAARPRRCNPRVGDDRVVGFHPTLCAPYGRSAVFGDSQRRVSPHFPTIAEALVRRQRKNEAIAARVLLALTGTFLLASPFAEHPWWMAGAAAACAIGFVITCIVAGSRHDQGGAYGTGSNVP